MSIIYVPGEIWNNCALKQVDRVVTCASTQHPQRVRNGLYLKRPAASVKGLRDLGKKKKIWKKNGKL